MANIYHKTLLPSSKPVKPPSPIKGLIMTAPILTKEDAITLQSSLIKQIFTSLELPLSEFKITITDEDTNESRIITIQQFLEEIQPLVGNNT